MKGNGNAAIVIDTHWNITPDYCKNMNVLVYEFHVVNLDIIKLFKS